MEEDKRRSLIKGQHSKLTIIERRVYTRSLNLVLVLERKANAVIVDCDHY